jgi:hypothetical protein
MEKEKNPLPGHLAPTSPAIVERKTKGKKPSPLSPGVRDVSPSTLAAAPLLLPKQTHTHMPYLRFLLSIRLMRTDFHQPFIIREMQLDLIKVTAFPLYPPCAIVLIILLKFS